MTATHIPFHQQTDTVALRFTLRCASRALLSLATGREGHSLGLAQCVGVEGSSLYLSLGGLEM